MMRLLKKGRSMFMSYIINDMFTVKSKRLCIKWYANIACVITGHRTGGLIHSLVILVKSFKHLSKHGGREYLVKYLKACHVMTMQASAGMVIPHARLLGLAVSRTRSGLPRILPPVWRRGIRSGDGKYIRLALTLFSLYRVLECKSKLKLGTITAPGVNLDTFLIGWHSFVSTFWENTPHSFNPELDLVAKPFAIRKSSSLSQPDAELVTSRQLPEKDNWGQSSTSVFSLIRSAAYWVQESCGPIFDWIDQTMNENIAEYIFQWSEEENFVMAPLPGFMENFSLGRLGIKKEAAGKVRVFAMVDPFTNWLLKPLHKWIFRLIRNWRCDGTFDQLAPILSLEEKGLKSFFCYDLSAATDRLPVTLQKALLGPIIGSSLAETWASLLVDRDYRIRNSEFKLDEVLRYAVGQPMGALSSWAMLALTHHALVQYAYFRSCSKRLRITRGLPSKGWSLFENYAVLGDDIVIADKSVARQYVRLMAEIGVGIGFEKSLISRNGTLEFAKRYRRNGVDLSPVPFLEYFAALSRLSDSVQFMRKYKLSMSQMFAVKGFGYKVLGSMNKTFTKLNKRVAIFSLTAFSPWSESESVTRFLLRRTPQGDDRKWESVIQSNLGAGFWEYLAHVQRALADRHAIKVKAWNAFAKKMGSEVDYEKATEGLFLDPYASQFEHEGLGHSSPRLGSQISMVLYYETMQIAWSELKEIEKELTWIYEWAMGICEGPRLVHYQVIEVWEDIHKHLYKIDQKMSLITIPSQTELRREDEERIFKNPLFIARLYRRVWAKLASAVRPPFVTDLFESPL